MKRITLFSLILFGIIACDKDNFETKPQIKVKEVSDEVVPFGGTFTVLFEYTDKEGDIDNTFHVIRERLNSKGPLVMDPIPYPVPEFPNKNKGEIQLNMPYAQGLTLGLLPIPIPGSGNQLEPDTLLLKFVLEDREGNTSDTVTANVVVIRQ